MLSEVLLRPTCLHSILGRVEKEVRRFTSQPEDWFLLFLNERGRCPIAVSQEEVVRSIGKIAKVL